jgi:hypothetical protein
LKKHNQIYDNAEKIPKSPTSWVWRGDRGFAERSERGDFLAVATTELFGFFW